MTSSRNFIILDDKNMATGRGSLSNDAELSNSKFVSAFKVEFDRLWKAKAGEIKALENGQYILGVHQVDACTFLVFQNSISMVGSSTPNH